MPGIVVKPRARIFHVHDWVYASEIRKLFGEPKAGDVFPSKIIVIDLLERQFTIQIRRLLLAGFRAENRSLIASFLDAGLSRPSPSVKSQE